MLKINEGSENVTVFVLGNTKSFKNLNQKELAVLHKNGDPRVSEEKPDAPVAPQAIDPQETPAVAEIAQEAKKEDKSSKEAKKETTK